VTTIMKPVSITMLIVVYMVLTIQIPTSVQPAYFVYSEDAGDSGGTKFLGALVNSLIFVGIILMVTFLFVALYYFHCIKLLFLWLVGSTGMLLAVFGGLSLVLLVNAWNAPMDYITFSILLWNFTLGGLAAIFWYSPETFNRGYLIAVSALMAVMFTRFPEWTTWMMLVALAIYDLFAVLCPGGPLKMLVEIAQTRDEPIPALLYNGSLTFMADRGERKGFDGGSYTVSAGTVSDEEVPVSTGRDGSGDHERERPGQISDEFSLGEEVENRPLVVNAAVNDDEDSDDDTETRRLLGTVEEELDMEEDERRERRSIKLGLGDFVFYSVLVGRAAMYDVVTIFTCFLGIVAGLAGTLFLLAVLKKALPALPFSIGLAMFFYFFTRWFVVPLVLTLGTEGVVV